MHAFKHTLKKQTKLLSANETLGQNGGRENINTQTLTSKLTENGKEVVIISADGRQDRSRTPAPTDKSKAGEHIYDLRYKSKRAFSLTSRLQDMTAG